MRIVFALILLVLAAPALAQVSRPDDVIYVADFPLGRCDGTTDARPAINAAISKAAGNGVGTVMLPRGTCRIDMSAGYIIPQSNVTLAGQGMGITTILGDDSTARTRQTAITNYVGRGWQALDHFTIRDLTLQGRGDVAHTYGGGDVIRLAGSNLLIERVESRYSRGFGMAILAGTDNVIRDSRVFRSLADGIVAWDTSNVLITGNQVIQAHDNAISAHSRDGLQSPVRSGVVISDNTIVESAAISVLGAKSVQIKGNQLRRMLGGGIIISTGRGGYAQGNTTTFALVVENNLVEDVFANPETPQFNGQQFYMNIDGGVVQAGTGASPPGQPAVGTGVVTPLYGTRHGNFYTDTTTSSSVASSGPHWLVFRNNVFVRTLPSVTHVSDWGYVSSSGGLWIAGSGDGTGFYNGAVTEANLKTPGITVSGPLRNTLIDGNIFDTSGSSCMFFANGSGSAWGAHDLDGLVITRNACRNFTVGGIYFRLPASNPQRVLIADNDIDGDPYFVSAARRAGGTWANGTGLPGIYAPTLIGLRIEGNRFRNLTTPDAALTTGVHNYNGNALAGQPVAIGYSAGNAGVGTWPTIDAGWRFIVEDSDPASATYGQALFMPYSSSAAMPASGTWVAGAFVSAIGQTSHPACSIPVLGWQRITTGSSNGVADWVTIGGRRPSIMAAGFPGEGGNITLPLDVNVLSIQSAGHFSAGTITLPDPSKEPVGCEFEILNGNLSVGALTVKAVAGTVTGAPAALVPYIPLGFVVVSTTEWRRSR